MIMRGYISKVRATSEMLGGGKEFDLGSVMFFTQGMRRLEFHACVSDPERGCGAHGFTFGFKFRSL